MRSRLACAVAIVLMAGELLPAQRAAAASSPWTRGWSILAMPVRPGVPGGPNGPGTTYGKAGGMPNRLLVTGRGLVAMGLGVLGQPPTEWRSTDGRIWQQIVLPALLFGSGRVNGAAAGPSALVAVGASSRPPSGPGATTYTAAAWVSYDGSAWHRAAGTGRAFAGGQMFAVSAGGPGFVAVGDRFGKQSNISTPPSQTMGVWVSPHGGRWQLVSNDGPVFRNAVANILLRTASGFVALGRPAAGPGINRSSHTIIWSSRDGRSWRRVPQAAGVFGDNQAEVDGAAGANGRYVAWGFTSEGGVPHDLVWVSNDGAHWRQAQGIHFQYGLVSAVEPHGRGFIALGRRDDEPTLWSSPDGARWTRVAGEDTFGGGDTRLGDAIDWKGRLVVVGSYNAPIPVNSSRPGEPVYRPTTWMWWPGTPGRLHPSWRASDPKWFRLHVEDMPHGFHPFGGQGSGGYGIGCVLGEEARLMPRQPQLPSSVTGPCMKAVAALGPSLPYFFKLPYGDGDNVPSVVGFAILTRSAASARSAFQYAQGLASAADLNNNKTPPAKLRPLAIGSGAVLFSIDTVQWGTAYAAVWWDGRALGVVEVEGVPGDRQSLAVILAQRQWRRRHSL